MKRSEIEKAQFELNDILERTQTPEEFHKSVDERMAKLQNKQNPRRMMPERNMRSLVKALSPRK